MNGTTFTSVGADASVARRSLKAARITLDAPHLITRTWFDTFDGRLREAGLRLEHRVGREQLLVLSGDGAASGHLVTPTVPRVAADLPPGPFRSRLADLLDVRALLPVGSVTARQSTGAQRNRSDKTVVRVALLDEINVDVDSDGAAPGWAIEVESLPGYDGPAQEVHRLLELAGLVAQDGDVFDLMVGSGSIELDHFDSSPTVDFAPGETAIDGYRRVFRRLLETIEHNWSGTIDDIDPEFLHDFRVAVRRTRSILTGAKGVMAEPLRLRYAALFKWLATATSEARDLDVYVIGWDDYVAPLPASSRAALSPVLASIGRRRAAAHQRLVRDLRSNRYRTFVASWRDWLDQPTDSTERFAARPVEEVATRRVKRANDRLVKQERALTALSAPEERHELRKDAKKLRYLIECFGSVYDKTARKTFVKDLKAMQELLGQSQDADVHIALLESLASDVTGDGAKATLLAMGQLTALLDQQRSAVRGDLVGGVGAYDTKSTRQKFNALIDSCR